MYDYSITYNPTYIDLINLVPYRQGYEWNLRDIYEIREIMDTETIELREIQVEMLRVFNNFYIQTADDETLKEHERILGLAISPNDTLDDRRNRIISRYQLTIPYTTPLLKEYLNSWLGIGNWNLDIVVEEFYIAVNVFTNDEASILNVRSLLLEMVPAHLGQLIVISDANWNEIPLFYGNDVFPVIQEKIVFSATPSGVEFNVTYTNDNADVTGTVIDPNSPYEYGDLVTILPPDGYTIPSSLTFNGWLLVGSVSTIYYPNDLIVITGDTELKAIWYEKPKTFITYHANSSTATGSTIDNTTYYNGDTITLLPNSFVQENTSLDFFGWSLDPDGDEILYPNDTLIAAGFDYDVYAIWRPKYIKVFYDKNSTDATGETIDNNEYLWYNVAIVKPNNFDLIGYNFMGWNLLPDGTGNMYQPNDELILGTENITLYAMWEAVTTVSLYNGTNDVAATPSSTTKILYSTDNEWKVVLSKPNIIKVLNRSSNGFDIEYEFPDNIGEEVFDISISPSAKFISVCSIDGGRYLFRRENSEQMLTRTYDLRRYAYFGDSSKTQFSHDGHYLVSYSKSRLLIERLDASGFNTIYNQNGVSISNVIFSWDNKHLIVFTSTGTLRHFVQNDSGNYIEFQASADVNYEVDALMFTKDDRFLVVSYRGAANSLAIFRSDLDNNSYTDITPNFTQPIMNIISLGITFDGKYIVGLTSGLGMQELYVLEYDGITLYNSRANIVDELPEISAHLFNDIVIMNNGEVLNIATEETPYDKQYKIDNDIVNVSYQLLDYDYDINSQVMALALTQDSNDMFISGANSPYLVKRSIIQKEKPINLVKAKDLPIGTIVKIPVENNFEEWIVVNQGTPNGNTALYGTYFNNQTILMYNRTMDEPIPNGGQSNAWYESSNLRSDTDEFRYRLSSSAVGNVRSLRIPVMPQGKLTGVVSGSSGLLCSMFIPSVYEILTNQQVTSLFGSTIERDGDTFEYFKINTTDNFRQYKRYVGSSPTNSYWQTRSKSSVSSPNIYQVIGVNPSGVVYQTAPLSICSTRPCFAINNEFEFEIEPDGGLEPVESITEKSSHTLAISKNNNYLGIGYSGAPYAQLYNINTKELFDVPVNVSGTINTSVSQIKVAKTRSRFLLLNRDYGSPIPTPVSAGGFTVDNDIINISDILDLPQETVSGGSSANFIAEFDNNDDAVYISMSLDDGSDDQIFEVYKYTIAEFDTKYELEKTSVQFPSAPIAMKQSPNGKFISILYYGYQGDTRVCGIITIDKDLNEISRRSERTWLRDMDISADGRFIYYIDDYGVMRASVDENGVILGATVLSSINASGKAPRKIGLTNDNNYLVIGYAQSPYLEVYKINYEYDIG